MSAILQLRLVAFRGLAPAISRMQEFDQDEVLIGRAPDNDFVVEDPERYCSRYHARCYRAENQFFVEDTSTPGTQVNAGHFLNRGHRHRLVSGDLLHIGECQIQVELIETVQTVQETGSGAFSIDDFFAGGSAPSEPDPAVNKVPLPNIPHTTSADFYDSIKPPEPVAVEPEYSHAVDGYGYEGARSEHEMAHIQSLDIGADVAPIPEQPSVISSGYEVQSQSSCSDDLGMSYSDSVAHTSVPTQELPPQIAAEVSPIEPVSVQAQQAAPPVNPPINSDADVDSRAIRAFLQGLDVQPSDLVGRNKEEIMFSAGQMLRILTQGIMEILLSRNDVKKEFGMDVTRIGAQMNNPLKFSNDAGDAMIKLLTEAEGYMSAHDAVKEGVVDAKAHQVAVMAGMQSSIVSMLERFKPESLEEQLTSRFVFSRKGKYWETYKEAYQQLVSEAEDDFNALFGDEFRQVYQQQVREIESNYSQN